MVGPARLRTSQADVLRQAITPVARRERKGVDEPACADRRQRQGRGPGWAGLLSLPGLTEFAVLGSGLQPADAPARWPEDNPHERARLLGVLLLAGARLRRRDDGRMV